MEFKDDYSILGVEPGAGEAEIKTAYRRQARKFHPDVSKEAGAEDKFKAVNEAYAALRDPHKRKAYDQLRAQGYRLQVFDCYRPVHAVTSFVAWVHDGKDQIAKQRYYPNIDKSRLLDGYIAETSGHSRAATVDLGVLDCRSMPCTALDMGTGFDRFDVLAHTANPDISAVQKQNRQLLLDAMQAQGFANYPMEWWHFTFKPEPTPTTAYDFPVR